MDGFTMDFLDGLSTSYRLPTVSATCEYNPLTLSLKEPIRFANREINVIILNVGNSVSYCQMGMPLESGKAASVMLTPGDCQVTPNSLFNTPTWATPSPDSAVNISHLMFLLYLPLYWGLELGIHQKGSLLHLFTF